MNFVSNILANSISGFVEAGTRSLGGYAGDALIKAGDVIENTGRNVGTSVENTAAHYGGAKSVSNKSSTGAYKKPVGQGAKAGATGSKAVVPYNSTAKTSATTTAAKKSLPKPYPNSIAYPSAKAKSNTKALPKPYPNNMAYPSANKSSAAPQSTNNKTQKPGAAKPNVAVTKSHSVPFVSPDNKSTQKSTQKSYPGQGEHKRTAVKKYKAAERYKPPFEKGAAVHLPEIKV